MQNHGEVVRIVCALGMGVGVNTIWHYGAPASLEDYTQESGRHLCALLGRLPQGKHPKKYFNACRDVNFAVLKGHYISAACTPAL